MNLLSLFSTSEKKLLKMKEPRYMLIPTVQKLSTTWLSTPPEELNEFPGIEHIVFVQHWSPFYELEETELKE